MPIISIPNSPKATGGDVRTIHLSGTNYVMHVFEKSGFFTVPADITGCTVLVVGGGGGGGASHGDNDTGKGGGGAGGVLFRNNFTIADATYMCGVGRGGYHPLQKGTEPMTGDYRAGGWTHSGMNGFDTHFVDESSNALIDVYALGGGGGGGGDNNGAAMQGGCGGGAGARNSTADWNLGASGIQPSFSNWTRAYAAGGDSANGNYCGAGGGGAGSNGGNHSGSVNYGTAGNGGTGIDYSSYFGTDVGDRGWFAGGGGGGVYRKGSWSYAIQGWGGKGGGGNGMFGEETSDGNEWRQNKIDGVDGTGGGGGGSSEDAIGVAPNKNAARRGCNVGTGGGGVIIIRYAQ